MSGHHKHRDKESLLRDVIVSALGSALFSTVSFFALYIWKDSSTDRGLLDFLRGGLEMPAWLFLCSHVLLGVIIFLFARRHHIRTTRGRAHTMSENLVLLRERHKLKPENKLICSTRLTAWPLSEKSSTRLEFRKELDQAVLVENYEVRRIWNVKDRDDASRLIEVVGHYLSHENVSIRVYFNIDTFLIPDMLIIGNRAASAAFPQRRRPFGIEACQFFRDRQGVITIQQYFDILWNNAAEMLAAGSIIQATMKKVEKLADK